MSTVLVVGASRGIGREFVRQYVADGDLIATYRRTEDSGELAALGATPVRLDVIEDDVAGVMARALGDRALDIAIISAGLYGSRISACSCERRSTGLTGAFIVSYRSAKRGHERNSMTRSVIAWDIKAVNR